MKKQELKQSIPVDTFYREHLGEPRSRTKNGMIYFCNFHPDKNRPNLHVGEDGCYKCFACGESGDVFDFHMKVTGKSFSESQTALAEKYAPHLIPNNGNGVQQKKIVARYPYKNEKGELIFQVVRYEPKDFRQQRPDGKGGWEWGLNGTKPILFKLPELIASTNTIYIVEGEKDVERLIREGLTATCNPMGAGKWKPEYDEYFKERDVIIIPDNDEPGRRHSKKVADSLNGTAKKIKVVDLSDSEEKQDVSDYLEDHSLAELLKKVDDAPTYVTEKKNQLDSKEDEEKLTQSQILIELASGAELFHTPDGEVYATFNKVDHRETWRIRSKGFRRWLVGLFYKKTGKAPGAQAQSDAFGVLESKAQFDGEEHQVYLRVGGSNGNIYIDLTNDLWEAIEISSEGWKVIKQSPIKFIRSRGMTALPTPVSGGSLDLLRQFVNVRDEGSWKLLIAYIISALRDRGPYPVLNLQGEQGSAKSTLVRLIRAIVDPSAVPLRTSPKDERDLMIMAKNSWILAFDNLSTIKPWLSDAICRLATGGGFGTRELYTDSEESLFDSQRSVVVNGIGDIATRDDFRDRALIINLSPIPEDQRKDEETFWNEFYEVRPKILGALLDGVSAGLKNLPNVRLNCLPRMADFAKWGTAVEPAFGWSSGSFMEAYSQNRALAVELGIEGDPVAQAVVELADDNEISGWEGTATELLDELEGKVSDKIAKSKAWPKTPQTLSNRLKRLSTILRATGVEVELGDRQGHKRNRIIVIRKGTQKTVRSVRINDNAQQNKWIDADDADDELQSNSNFSDGASPIGN